MTDPVSNPQPEDKAEEVVVAVPAAANSNEAQAPSPKISKKGKILSAIFNMAAGAAATAAVKMAIGTAMIGFPPLAILIATSFAVGAVMTAACHEGQRRAAKKAGNDAPDFFSRQNMKDFFLTSKHNKTFIKSTLFAFVGGALFLGFQEGLIQEGFNKIFGSTPAPAAPLPPVVVPVDVPPVAPVVEAAPVSVPCPTPLEHFADVIKDHAVSDRVQDAMNRAASTNAKIAAQGAKDLAYFAFNGFDGVPKDATVALELFQKAADAGNVQAKVDLLYMQFHGLGGVTANPQAAVDAMQHIRTPRAEMFVQQWADMGQHGAKAAEAAHSFDSKAILQGVKFCAQ